MPSGFPWNHPRFWANEALPPVLLVIAVGGLVGILTRNVAIARSAMLVLCGFWTAALCAATLLFPISRSRFLAPLGFLAITMGCAYGFSRVPRSTRRWSGVAALFAGALAGAAAPLSQRAPEASTVPAGGRLGAIQIDEQSPRGMATRVSDRLQVIPPGDTVIARLGPLSVELSPLLTFMSCSPDRCWTILSPRSQLHRPPRVFLGQRSSDNQAALEFGGDARHLLRIRDQGPLGCEIEATAELAEPVYSHLNSFSEVMISGHRDLALAFSPCPSVRITAEPSDYPVGRPERFAYLDGEGVFHVVEASSGEKGPFKVLGSGRLSREEALSIALYDQSKRVGAIVFLDWSGQGSAELSPTAGWGVPMNAIEFRRLGDAPQSPVAIWLTLAGTSIGRGWDSVGHRAGVYRNRIQIKNGSGATR